MIFSVNIYVIIFVIKMSDDEAVDIAIAVANASPIYNVHEKTAPLSMLKIFQN